MSDIPFLNSCSDERDSKFLSSLSAGLGSSGVAAVALTVGWKHPKEARQASVEHTTDLLLDQDWLQLHTTMGRAEVAEAQLLRCSCRFTRGQSELSVIIIALRRKRVQGCAHLTMSAASILSRRSCRKRRTTLDNSHHGAATRRNFVWSGLWWQTAMGQ